jgi:YD repeat-containing protein
VISTTRSGRTISYTYDALSNVLTETQPQGTVTYQYDLAGRRTRMEWPDGEAAVYNWYGGPDLITISIAGSYNQTLATYIYDNLGRVTLSGRSNGSSTTYSYGAVSALDAFSTLLLGTANDQTVSFTRDAARPSQKTWRDRSGLARLAVRSGESDHDHQGPYTSQHLRLGRRAGCGAWAAGRGFGGGEGPGFRCRRLWRGR